MKRAVPMLALPMLALPVLALIVAPVGPAARANDTMPAAPWAWRQLPDPKQEARAEALMESLRCLVCQSQSIADSDAAIAGDMRNEVRRRIAAGEDPEAIRRWLVSRYGDYVTYAPRLTALTWPLFAAPLAFLLLAGLLVRRRFRTA